jgi:hypothetical protein
MPRGGLSRYADICARAKKTWWGVIPAFIAIAIPTMMQVGPDDAVINFCKWPRKAFPLLMQRQLQSLM